jgi:hypothetical protein
LIEIPICEEFEGGSIKISIGMSFNALYRGGIVTSLGGGFAASFTER